MARDQEPDDVNWISERLDASATVRLVIYMLGIVFAAALVVWQVRSLAEGQQQIKRDLQFLTDPKDGLMVRFSRLETDLNSRVREAEKEHQAFERRAADHENRLRAMETGRRYNGGRGGGS